MLTAKSRASDLNQDGKADVVWRNTAMGENKAWHMDGVTHADEDSLLPVADANWKILRITGTNGGRGPILAKCEH